MKILLYNLAYCTGVDGSAGRYVSHSLRHLVRPLAHRPKYMDDVQALVEREKPDVCCFVEIDSDSPLLQRMSRDFPHVESSHKYKHDGWLRRMPLVRTKGMAVLSKKPCIVRKHYFPSGMKRLVYEVETGCGHSIFTSHFSLGRSARAKQIDFVSQLTHERTKTIVCGDFNIFGGVGELADLTDRAGMRLANDPAHFTFPSVSPRRMLDVFLHSPDVRVQSLRVLSDVRLSDHLPVVLETSEG